MEFDGRVKKFHTVPGLVVRDVRDRGGTGSEVGMGSPGAPHRVSRRMEKGNGRAKIGRASGDVEVPSLFYSSIFLFQELQDVSA